MSAVAEEEEDSVKSETSPVSHDTTYLLIIFSLSLTYTHIHILIHKYTKHFYTSLTQISEQLFNQCKGVGGADENSNH